MGIQANEPDAVELWDDPIAQYAFDRACDLATSRRHLQIRLLLQRCYGGTIPPVRELQAALRAQGITATQKVLRADLAAMSGPPPK